MYRSPSRPSQDTARDAAQDRMVATSIAPRYLLSRKLLDASIESSHEVADEYVRAGFLVERRVPVLQWVAAPRKRRWRKAPEPSDIDPWAQHPDEVPAATIVYTACFSCHGEAEHECGRCDGSTRVRCWRCSGSGRVGNHPDIKGCPSCRAVGTNRCGLCDNGRVRCESCDATGTVEAWIAIEVSVTGQVQAVGDGPAARVHQGLRDYQDLAGVTWSNRLLGEVNSPGIAPNLEQGLAPSYDVYTERVLQTHVQRFRGLATIFVYRTVFGVGTIEVAGDVPTVSPSSQLDSLAKRRGLMLLAQALLLGAAVGVWRAYVGRHPWYAAHGAGVWVLTCAVLATLATTWVLSFGLLSAAARKLTYPWLGTLVIVLAAGGGFTAWRAKEPDLRTAHAHVAALQLAAATAEANAVRELTGDVEGADRVFDEIHLVRFEQARLLATKAHILKEPWASAERKQVAIDRMLVLADEEAAASPQSANELRTLASMVHDYDPARAELWSGRADLRDAQTMFSSARWARAVEFLTQAARRLGASSVVESAARMERTLDTELRREVIEARKLKGAALRHEKWSALRERAELVTRLRGMAGITTPADWAAVEKRVATEVAKAQREVEAQQRRKGRGR